MVVMATGHYTVRAMQLVVKVLKHGGVFVITLNQSTVEKTAAI